MTHSREVLDYWEVDWEVEVVSVAKDWESPRARRWGREALVELGCVNDCSFSELDFANYS